MSAPTHHLIRPLGEAEGLDRACPQGCMTPATSGWASGVTWFRVALVTAKLSRPSTTIAPRQTSPVVVGERPPEDRLGDRGMGTSNVRGAALSVEAGLSLEGRGEEGCASHEPASRRSAPPLSLPPNAATTILATASRHGSACLRSSPRRRHQGNLVINAARLTGFLVSGSTQKPRVGPSTCPACPERGPGHIRAAGSEGLRTAG
jgi:hypothetical protein